MERVFWEKKDIVNLWSKYSKDVNLCKKIQSYYTTKLTSKMIVNTANLGKEALILDAGCGWGRIACELIEMGYNNVIGVDLTLDLLKFSKKYGFLRYLVNADIKNLPFESNKFDCVYAVRVLQYIEKIELALKEFVRVLKLGGKCIIIQPNPRNPYRKIAYHARLIPVSNIKNLLQRFGFKNITINYYGFSHPKFPIIFCEKFAKIPFLKTMGLFYLVKGELYSK